MARDGHHVSAVFFRPILDLAVARVGRPRTEAVLRRLGTTESVLRDPSSWVSLGLTEQVCDAFIEETRDPEFVEEACGLGTGGRYLWLIRPVLRLFGSPELAYREMAAALPRFNRAGTLSIEDVRDHSVVFEYRSELETRVQLCRGRMRQFAMVPTLFGLDAARVEHRTCMHRGDDRCRYEVHWAPAPSTPLRTVTGTALGVGAAAGVAAFMGIAPELAVICTAAGGVLGGFASRRDP